MACEELKEKYQHREDRIKSMCKAISATLQTKILVSVARNGTARFEIIGQRIKRASDYIQDEFCKVHLYYMYFPIVEFLEIVFIT